MKEKRVGLRKRFSQLFNKKQRPGRSPKARQRTPPVKTSSRSPHAAQALRPGPNVASASNAPSAPAHALMVDLTRRCGRIRGELAPDKGLVTDLLTPLMTLMEFHCGELRSVVEEGDARIELADARWKLDHPLGKS